MLYVPVMERRFLSSLVKLNMFLETPHPQELDQNPNLTVSSRRFLDGDTLTLADCNLLPKLHVVKVSTASTVSWMSKNEALGSTEFVSRGMKIPFWGRCWNI